MNWFQQARHMFQWLVFLPSSFLKDREFLDQLSDYQLPKNSSPQSKLVSLYWVFKKILPMRWWEHVCNRKPVHYVVMGITLYTSSLTSAKPLTLPIKITETVRSISRNYGMRVWWLAGDLACCSIHCLVSCCNCESWACVTPPSAADRRPRGALAWCRLIHYTTSIPGLSHVSYLWGDVTTRQTPIAHLTLGFLWMHFASKVNTLWAKTCTPDRITERKCWVLSHLNLWSRSKSE
jgi:hypothetical protein